MTITKDQFLEYLEQASVIELFDTIEMFYAKFNIKPPYQQQVQQQTVVEEVEEQSEFDVVVTDAGLKRINVIKIIRAETSLDLKSAKGLIDNLPATVMKELSEGQASELQRKLTDAGATVELK
jgi:large subunit ribosomal protein L7/L12